MPPLRYWPEGSNHPKRSESPRCSVAASTILYGIKRPANSFAAAAVHRSSRQIDHDVGPIDLLNPISKSPPVPMDKLGGFSLTSPSRQHDTLAPLL